MRSLLICSFVFLSASVGQAQSCPSADSLLGRPRNDWRVHRAWDRLTDTTRLEIHKDVTHLWGSAPSGVIYLTTKFEGREPHGQPITTLEFGTATTRRGSQQMSTDQALFPELNEAILLVDDSIRSRLPKAGYRAQVKQAGVLTDDRLEERVAFAVSPDQLRSIATASHKVEVAAGPIRAGFGEGDIHASRELMRAVMCSNTSAAP
jgi:hypothetical protein